MQRDIKSTKSARNFLHDVPGGHSIYCMETGDMTTREIVTRNVRRAMFEADLTQSELAGQMTITRETLRHRLNGKKPFTIDELEEIARATRVPFSSLVNVDAEAGESK